MYNGFNIYPTMRTILLTFCTHVTENASGPLHFMLTILRNIPISIEKEWI